MEGSIVVGSVPDLPVAMGTIGAVVRARSVATIDVAEFERADRWRRAAISRRGKNARLPAPHGARREERRWVTAYVRNAINSIFGYVG